MSILILDIWRKLLFLALSASVSPAIPVTLTFLTMVGLSVIIDSDLKA